MSLSLSNASTYCLFSHNCINNAFKLQPSNTSGCSWSSSRDEMHVQSPSQHGAHNVLYTFFPQHDKTSVKEVVDDLSLFWWEYKSWRMCVNPVKEEQKRICYPCVALLLFFPLNFVLHLTIQQTISGMRVLVAWWNHHLSALGINPSCQRRSMNSISSNAACWVGISIPIRQTLIVHCKGWCFILSLLNTGVHFSAHAVAWREKKMLEKLEVREQGRQGDGGEALLGEGGSSLLDGWTP